MRSITTCDRRSSFLNAASVARSISSPATVRPRWPLERHTSVAQHDRLGRAPMPGSLPLRELGVRGAADLGGRLRGHHLAITARPTVAQDRQQPRTRDARDRAERQAQHPAATSPPRSLGRDRPDRQQLRACSSVGPLRLSVDLAVARHLPPRQVPGGGPPPHRNKTLVDVGTSSEDVRPPRSMAGPACCSATRTPSVAVMCSPTLDPPHRTIPVHQGDQREYKALVTAGAVGAGGVEPPSSSVSANLQGTAVRRPVFPGRARP